MPETAPQSRAGRLRLKARLSTARRGLDLLDRKRKLLQTEEARLSGKRDEAQLRLCHLLASARSWAERSAVLGGRSDLLLARSVLQDRAGLDVTWQNTMGVQHPSSYDCTTPELSPLDAAAVNSAMRDAALAYREALDAAIAGAVAEEAYRRLHAELTATKRRVRAIERYRIPQLEGALRNLEQRLDELEREERLVARWARNREVAPT